MSAQLVEPFLEKAPLALRPAFASVRDLEARLRALIDGAREAWPGIEVDHAGFIAYAAERLPEDAKPDDALAALRVADLYLSFACRGGDKAALSAFDTRYMREVDPALGRMRIPAAQIDEIKQMVWQKLFVGDDGKNGKIDAYSGRGDLRRWVRSIAVRTCLNQMRKHKRERLGVDDRVMNSMASDDDPEIAYMKQRYRSEFREAFVAALNALTDREQNLLRHHYVDSLNIDEIGAIYRVHRVTAYRWLEKARESLVGQTQKLLMAQLRVEKREFDSILRMIRSQLHVSLVRYLKRAAPGATSSVINRASEVESPEDGDDGDGDGDGDDGADQLDDMTDEIDEFVEVYDGDDLDDVSDDES